MIPAEAVAEAYAHCEAVTKEQAANFFYGIRLLPAERRRAMSAAYAFARRVDDIGDGTLERAEKLRRLAAEERALATVETDPSALDEGDLVMVALADAYARFPLPAGALGELIDGVRMDVEGVSYETFEELVLYCRRVAGAIGRVCLAIFGMREGARSSPEHAAELADVLGVAMQLTNILRDVREDAENGRVYLPREDLLRFALITERDGAETGSIALEVRAAISRQAAENESEVDGHLSAGDHTAALVRFEAARAREWFDRGMALAPLLDRRSAACVLAMAGIYRRLLDRIEADPGEAMRRRMSLPASEKAWVAARGMLRGGA
jgi:phytoene synthase